MSTSITTKMSTSNDTVDTSYLNSMLVPIKTQSKRILVLCHELPKAVCGEFFTEAEIYSCVTPDVSSHGIGTLDCIMDHTTCNAKEQIRKFETLWPLLRAGGYYVIVNEMKDFPMDDSRIDSIHTQQNWTLVRKAMIPPNIYWTVSPVPNSTVMVSYATDHRYEESRKNSIQWAKSWGMNQFLCYTQNDLGKTFRNEYASVLRHPRGAGYWAWKPYIILATMLNTNVETIVYCDSGSGTSETLPNLLEKARTHKLVGFELGYHRQYEWTKRDAFILTDTDNSPQHHALQRCATVMAISNTPEMRQFVKQWLDYCKDERIITDQPSVLGSDYPGFVENRHDQCIFSLLTYKLNVGYFLPDNPYLLHHHFGSVHNFSPPPAPPAPCSKSRPPQRFSANKLRQTIGIKSHRPNFTKRTTRTTGNPSRPHMSRIFRNTRASSPTRKNSRTIALMRRAMQGRAMQGRGKRQVITRYGSSRRLLK